IIQFATNRPIDDHASVTGINHFRIGRSLFTRQSCYNLSAFAQLSSFSEREDFDIVHCFRRMTRLLFKLIICVLIASGAAIAYLAISSGDPVYTLYEGISPARFHQYDGLIRAVAAKRQLDPMLVKAVVWRESRFDPQKFGTAGERGLMQVSEKAAHEWARE